jgi:hypothetical protein
VITNGRESQECNQIETIIGRKSDDKATTVGSGRVRRCVGHCSASALAAQVDSSFHDTENEAIATSSGSMWFRQLAPVTLIMRLTLSTILLVCLMSACTSANKPSDREALAQIKAQVLQDDLYKLKVIEFVDIRKTNGYEDEGNYVVQGQYDVAYKMTDKEEGVLCDTSKNARVCAHFGGRGMLDADHPPGEKFAVDFSIPFRKTENGWKIAD